VIRELILAGRLAEARQLLGRPPSVIGTVVRGDRRGTALGIPTANLALHHAVKPPAGVYAADVPLDGRLHRAVVNIGTRPTFKETDAQTIEAHLLDYAGGDLYGRVLEVRFLGRLRDERRFQGVEQLKSQIDLDIQSARSLKHDVILGS
jgi:riboflavin kinase/FMN adenylyltransferase